METYIKFFYQYWRDEPMSTKTGTMFYTPVNYATLLTEGPVYIRASQSLKGRVFLRLPAAVGTGVYISPGEASLLRRQLENAMLEGERPLQSQRLEVTFADGTVGYVPLSKNTKRAVKSRVV